MSEPYLRYEKSELSISSGLFAHLAEEQYKAMKYMTIEDRRREQKILSNVRVIPARVAVRPVVCDGVPSEWVFLRRKTEEKRIILYLHGGSWAFGSLESARPASVLLAEATGFKVLMVAYRLTPENPYPAGLEDSYRVYRWLLAQGYKPTEIGLFGDSAGGNLCLALMHQLQSERLELPSCCALASPVTDMTLDSAIIKSDIDMIYLTYHEEFRDIFSLYLGELHHTDRRNPLISPIMGDLSGFPPLLIHTGGTEPLAEDNINFIAKAFEQGVKARVKIWEGMFHDFSIVGVTLKESRQSMAEIGNFYKKHIKRDIL